MTDPTSVKAMLVTALDDASTGHDIFFRNPDAPSFVIHVGDFDDADRQIEIDADRLAATVTAHFLDREKVKAALIAALDDVDVSYNNRGFGLTAFYHDEDGHLFFGTDNDPECDGPVHEAFTTGVVPINDLIDRLIAALAGGQS